jgi:hypothetical protein
MLRVATVSPAKNTTAAACAATTAFQAEATPSYSKEVTRTTCSMSRAQTSGTTAIRSGSTNNTAFTASIAVTTVRAMPGAVSLMPNVLNALEKVKEKVYV